MIKMAVEQGVILDHLKHKIEKVFNLYERLKTENAALAKEKDELKKALKDKESELEFIKNKYNKLKLAKSILASTGDKHDAKIKINGIVREIDKCIALLNR
jgi:chromosome segregation ATPase